MSANAVELTFPAKAEYLVLARLAIAGLAPVLHADEETIADLKLAVTEAGTNAVRHAYGDAGGDVRLSVGIDAGSCTLEVADEGIGIGPGKLREWDTEELAEAGMGFTIMRTIADEVELTTGRSGAGTVVRLSKRLAD